ncbi:MAG: hypothetical protein ACKVHR_15650 [Pirellulales bacterium]
MENNEPTQSFPSLSGSVLEEGTASYLFTLSQYSNQRISESQFYHRVLEITAAVTGSRAAVIWKAGSGRSDLLAEYPPKTGLIEVNQIVPSADLQKLLSTLLSKGVTQYFGLSSNQGEPGLKPSQTKGSNDYGASFHLLKRDEKNAVLIAVSCDAKMDVPSSRIVESWLLLVGQLVSNYYRNIEHHSLHNQVAFAESLMQFSKQLRGFFTVDALLYEIVNEAASVIASDRVTAFQWRVNRFEMVAISGVSTINPSSELCKLLTAAVNEVAGKHLPAEISLTDADVQSDAFGQPVANYFAKASCRQMIAMPMRPSGETVENAFRGVLLFESFSDSHNLELNSSLTKLMEQVDLALSYAIEFEERVESRWHFLGDSQGRSRSQRKMFGGVIIGVLILCLFFIKSDFQIKAAGQILPLNQQRIFSPADGEITKVYDPRDNLFKEGEPLIQIRSSELEMQLSRIKGERLANQEKLLAIESRRITGSNRSESGLDNSNSALSASAEELRILLESQNAQLAILNREFESLKIDSPLAGKIITWQFKKLLDSRPVQRGQLLMTIADVEGDWIGELEISDYRAGYVMDAMRNSETLPVSLVLVSSPDRTHSGMVLATSFSTDEDQLGQPIMRATIAVDWEGEIAPRSGAKIIAKIKCGRKSLAFKWFHEPLAAVRAALF